MPLFRISWDSGEEEIEAKDADEAEMEAMDSVMFQTTLVEDETEEDEDEDEDEEDDDEEEE